MYAANGNAGVFGNRTASSGTSSPRAMVGYLEAGGSVFERIHASMSTSSARWTHRGSAKLRNCWNCCPGPPRVKDNGPDAWGVPLRKYKREVGASGASAVPSSLVCVSEPARAQYSVDENV